MKIKIWINAYDLQKINWNKFECFVTCPTPLYVVDYVATEVDITDYLIERREYKADQKAHKVTLVKLTPQLQEQRRLDLAL